MKDGMWCSHAAGPRIWWEVRHWWYNHVSGPWLASPLGQVIRKSRGYDEVVRQLRAHEAQDNAEIWNLRIEVRQLRENRDLLREALEIRYEGQQDQLELLLVEAEATLHKREDSEPF
jgi:hypothetical protein